MLPFSSFFYVCTAAAFLFYFFSLFFIISFHLIAFLKLRNLFWLDSICSYCVMCVCVCSIAGIREIGASHTKWEPYRKKENIYYADDEEKEVVKRNGVKDVRAEIYVYLASSKEMHIYSLFVPYLNVLNEKKKEKIMTSILRYIW